MAAEEKPVEKPAPAKKPPKKTTRAQGAKGGGAVGDTFIPAFEP
jgi:hypothetical protein